MNADMVQTVKHSRNQLLDFLRGLCIVFVVLGHAIQVVYDPDNYNVNVLYKIAYSFHMPLMFAISGYLTGWKNELDTKWILKRASRLLIPCLLWTAIPNLINGTDAYGIFYRLIIDPVYWFLITLFLFDCIVFAHKKIINGKYSLATGVVIFGILMGLFVVTKNENSTIRNLALYYPFYWGGYCINNVEKLKKQDLKKLYLEKKKYIWLIAYPIAMLGFTYKQYDEIIPRIQKFINLNGTLIKLAIHSYNHYFVPLLGIVFFVILSDFAVNKLNKTSYYVAKLGEVTLSVYLMHEFFFFRLDNALVAAIISFSLGLFVPVIVKRATDKILPKIGKYIVG